MVKFTLNSNILTISVAGFPDPVEFVPPQNLFAYIPEEVPCKVYNYVADLKFPGIEHGKEKLA